MAKTKDEQLDNTTARYEERLVELHSVIAELSRLVNTNPMRNIFQMPSTTRGISRRHFYPFLFPRHLPQKGQNWVP